MAVHQHPVKDVGFLFEIDPISRAITYLGTNPLLLMQFDHDSERYTFRLPRRIEEHDMSFCNKVEIHYINIGIDDRFADVYIANDLHIDTDDTEYVKVSWLISENATRFPGTLSFMIRFRCTEGDAITYTWGTGIFSNITVGEGFNNSQTVIDRHSDILETWKASIVNTHEWDGTRLVVTSASGTSSADLRGPNAYEVAIKNGFVGTEKEWLESLNGKSAYEIAIKNGFNGAENEWLDYISGYAKTVMTIDGKFLHFFVGTKAEYDKLGDDKKNNLFAIITDEPEPEPEPETPATTALDVDHLYYHVLYYDLPVSIYGGEVDSKLRFQEAFSSPRSNLDSVMSKLCLSNRIDTNDPHTESPLLLENGRFYVDPDGNNELWEVYNANVFALEKSVTVEGMSSPIGITMDTNREDLTYVDGYIDGAVPPTVKTIQIY